MAETFATLIQKGASPQDIEAHLDGLNEAERVAQVRAIGGSLQEKLWKLVKGAGKVDIDSFVKTMDSTVIYAGKNSLPVFNKFEKRFYRRADPEPVVGYNHQKMSAFTGPGYFTTKNGDDGELVFDYIDVPSFQPPSWPAIRKNSGLIAGPVYGHMIDYNRHVSKNTVIGAATKKGKPMGQYYLLTLSSQPTL